jgi:hypothetical protein
LRRNIGLGAPALARLRLTALCGDQLRQEGRCRSAGIGAGGFIRLGFRDRDQRALLGGRNLIVRRTGQRGWPATLR